MIFREGGREREKGEEVEAVRECERKTNLIFRLLKIECKRKY
jgi:hypothetical protein